MSQWFWTVLEIGAFALAVAWFVTLLVALVLVVRFLWVFGRSHPKAVERVRSKTDVSRRLEMPEFRRPAR